MKKAMRRKILLTVGENEGYQFGVVAWRLGFRP